MIIGHIGGGAVGGYEIDKSLRLRAAASAYLSRTPGAAGNRKTWTWSGWVKRGILGGSSTYTMFDSRIDANNASRLYFEGSDTLNFLNVIGGTITTRRTTSAVFRDPSAHLHVVCIYDTANAVAADRCILYVNGARQLIAIAVDPILDYADGRLNTANSHSIGRAGTEYLDGYLSEIHFIDGQALTPDSFGEFNSDGVWVPKKYTGTYGTNGFYLPFNDGTNLTELCRDRSGNGNDWTANNISLTAGATYDWMDDTSTNNFATLNPLAMVSGTPSAGNLSYTTVNASITNCIHSSIAFPTSGKWYCEVVINSVTGTRGHDIGLTRELAYTKGVVWSGFNGNKVIEGVSTSYGATYTTGDICGIAFDADTMSVEFFKNNTSQGVVTGISPGTYFLHLGDTTSSGWSVLTANFGQRPFAYTPPAGFKALCTKNRPSVTITDPRQHHTVITVTKSGDTNFTLPWNATDFDTLFWIKRRDASGDWYQIDGLRGYDKILKSNSTAAETTDANVIGVSGTTCTLKSTLPNGTYVIYAWKAGLASARQTNTDGSITSTVSRNVTAGFSIVTYTGTGANATVGHGLGNVPRMVVAKVRSVAGNNWVVHHGSLGATDFMRLNTTDVKGTSSTVFNGYPTSTVVSLGTDGSANTNAGTHVAYFHAEIPGYSKFGSYTGNGSTDGPFVWGDVSVMDVLVKRAIGAAEGWQLLDGARNANNAVKSLLEANNTNAEITSTLRDTDFVANGLKIRNNSGGMNGTSDTYIYAAYARHPFGAENVSPATAR